MAGRPRAYEILGVDPGADPEAIQRAYRALVKIAHPDHAGETPEVNARFLEIKAAYEILRDPERRAAHDRDPDHTLDEQLTLERRRASLRRRRRRLMRLYDR